MNITPIKINIKENFKFGRVAFLVDRNDFLIDINVARKKLGIRKPINREKEYDKYHKSRIKLEQSGEADYLLNKYRRPRGYFGVIISAILTGRVNEQDLVADPYFIHHFERYDFVDLFKPQTGEAAVIIYPETKKKDWNNIYLDYKKRVRKYHDTMPNIKRDRAWYWEKKKRNIGYQRLWKLIDQGEIEGGPIEKSSVEKAIIQYSKKLQTEIKPAP